MLPPGQQNYPEDVRRARVRPILGPAIRRMDRERRLVFLRMARKALPALASDRSGRSLSALKDGLEGVE